MELKVGMYVRTKLNDFCNMVAIRKIEEIDEDDDNKFWIDDYIMDTFGDEQNKLSEEDVDKASDDITELIKAGDVIETPKGVFKVGYIENNVIYTDDSKVIACLRKDEHLCFENTTIISIVTKEMFDSVKYEVG
ncbi:MAG TPA: hypothetical protein IAB45_03440 [Candidatus Onthousia faecavium]|nr:hypothetical protein [Candidatus Onthousia faecavium]